MRLDDALEQLSAIHVQVLRSETYRGYRAVPTAATGVLAFAAAVVQIVWLPAADPVAFAQFWITVALLAGMVFGTDLAVRTLRDRDRTARRRTAQALGQLVPAVVVGAVVTAALLDTVVADRLPALWAMLFGLGLVASRPFLPYAIGAVATFYVAAGFALLLPALHSPDALSAGMGLTFGVGQLWVATILHRAEEQRHGG